MRQIIAFLGSILLNGGVIFAIIYYLDAVEEKNQTVVTEAANFDLGMIVGANTITKQPSQQSQTRQARRSIESTSEAQPVLEPEPIVEPEPKPEPIVKPEAAIENKRSVEPEAIMKPMEKPAPVVKKTERKIKRKIVKTVEKRKSEQSHTKKPIPKKSVPKISREKPTKRTQNQIVQKVSVGIGLGTINTVKNQSKSTASQGGKSASKQSKKSNANTYRAGLLLAIKRIADKTARHMRKQGIVRVRFNLERDGRIDNVRLVGSSGDNALDKAGTKVLNQLGRYQTPPPDFPTILTVPIVFRPR